MYHMEYYIYFINYRLTRSLPAGKSFVCMDLKHIPQIIQQIFMSSIMNVF